MKAESNLNDNTIATHGTARLYLADNFLFYANASAGTMGGACLFGLLWGCLVGGAMGGILGATFGPIIAFFVGAVVLGNIAIVAWTFWLFRYYRVCAIVGGSLTGFVCTLPFVFAIPGVFVVLVASMLGGAGAGLAASRFVHNAEAGRRFAIASQNQSRTFTLREMFVHFAVLTVVIALWGWLFRLDMMVR